jgi:hypothetical protein
MIIALIGIGWLVIALMCWALCAMTARADGRSPGEVGSARTARIDADRDEQGAGSGAGLTAWESLPQLTVRETGRTVLGANCDASTRTVPPPQASPV